MHVKKEVNDQLLDFETGIIAKKGFESEIPCLIQWNKLPEKREKIEHICLLKNLQLFSENHSQIQLLFDTLGVEMKVFEGPSKMVLTIDSPKGEVIFEGGGTKFSAGIGGIIKVIKLYINHLINKNI